MKRASLAALLPVLIAFAGSARADSVGAAASEASRVDVSLSVVDSGSYLVLDVRISNPYRCDWRGDLYLETQVPPGAVTSVGRSYGLVVPGGGALGMSVRLARPTEIGTHVFFATAYRSDGEDKESFNNCSPLGASCSSSPAAIGPMRGQEATASASASLVGAEPADCATALLPAPPIRVDLTLNVQPQQVSAMSAWGNTTRLDWTGDLYVDMTSPSNEITLVRREIGTLIPAGIGFCTSDDVRRPAAPGVYVVRARALHRDGGAKALWQNSGTTEIVAVCNSVMCERIAPDQSGASIALTGPSSIDVESDFFSEYTTVTLAYGGQSFDITDRCQLNQYPDGNKSHTHIAFDTMNLPIGPRTRAEYTIRVHPMPMVPPGAKLTDSLWILTNGPE
jgi:hypothetical protein